MHIVAKNKKPRNQLAVEFGQRLRSLREGRGWSVSAAAEAADMAYSAYARLERGEREPSLSTLRRLAEALGCTPNDLLGYGTVRDVE